MIWLFRVWCDNKLRAAYDELKGDHATLESRLAIAVNNYARANEALADCQQVAASAQKSARQLLASVKSAHAAQLAELREANAVLDQANADLSGQLADANERLQLIDREEDMRDEVAVKRRADQ